MRKKILVIMEKGKGTKSHTTESVYNGLLRHGREKALVAAVFLGGMMGPAQLLDASNLKTTAAITTNATNEPIENAIFGMENGIKKLFTDIAIAGGIYAIGKGTMSWMKVRMGLEVADHESKNRRFNHSRG